LRHRYGSLSTSALGLVLLYAGSLQRASMNLMMRLTELETEFVSVERVADFARIEMEEHVENDLPNMGREGLSKRVEVDGAHARAVAGAIELRAVCLRYRLGRPPAFRNLSLSIPAGAC
jgi:ABC-type multidrug transport system fused ATPase/permease subunit